MMLLDDFKHSILLTTRFSDGDVMGHVNNARYATYLEEARIQYARDVFGWNGEPDEIGMILVKTVIDYLMPLRVGNTIKVHTRCSRIGRKSFDLNYIVMIEGKGALVSTATTTMVAYDYQREASVLVSDEWKKSVLAYEKIKPEV